MSWNILHTFHAVKCCTTEADFDYWNYFLKLLILPVLSAVKMAGSFSSVVCLVQVTKMMQCCDLETFFQWLNKDLPLDSLYSVFITWLQMNTALIHSHVSQRLMFQDLISFDVNESFASTTNPRAIWMKLSIILCCILTPLPRWWFSLTPLFISHAKYTNGVLPLGIESAYGHHEYLPELITGTHSFITNERKHSMWTAGLPASLHLKLCYWLV